jgi:DNA-binding transcriptional regulator YiaG
LTPAAFRELTADLGFTTGDVAVLMGVTRRTPQLWLSGHSPIPQSAAILLEAIKEGLVTIEWLEDRILETIKLS